MERLTLEIFIQRSNIIHNDEYQYSKFNYINNHIKGFITCNIHGDFSQRPKDHLKGNGCPKCSIFRKMSLAEFIIRANKIHDNKYQYLNFVYINIQTKGIITCSNHGEFIQRPADHLNGNGCTSCWRERLVKLNTKDINYFIEKANAIHHNKYDYSEFVYTNSSTKSIIICKLHGRFLQKPNNHTQGEGCPRCKAEKLKNLRLFNQDDVIIYFNQIHNHKYDYTKLIYKGDKVKCIIICPIHGEFKQTAGSHRAGNGCQKCNLENLKKINLKDKEFFIEKANAIHNNKYDYSKFEYVNCKTKSIIICKNHGDFQQTSNDHLTGSGCPSCKYIISKQEIAWLDYLNVPALFRHKTIFINNKRYNLDALDENTKTIWEFYGDYWHGNPNKYNPDIINPTSKKSFGQLYQNTIKKEIDLNLAGYKIISIWEEEWKKLNI